MSETTNPFIGLTYAESLALLAAAWLALWLWARGGPSLDWGPTGGRVRPADDSPTTT